MLSWLRAGWTVLTPRQRATRFTSDHQKKRRDNLLRQSVRRYAFHSLVQRGFRLPQEYVDEDRRGSPYQQDRRADAVADRLTGCGATRVAYSFGLRRRPALLPPHKHAPANRPLSAIATTTTRRCNTSQAGRLPFSWRVASSHHPLTAPSDPPPSSPHVAAPVRSADRRHV
jgi:hypothetical protein